MNRRTLFPNAIDHIRYINHNIVNNARRGKTSFLLLPDTYEYAFMLTHETGELPAIDGVVAPDENAEDTGVTVDIFTL
jgi:hypothetical protein